MTVDPHFPTPLTRGLRLLCALLCATCPVRIPRPLAADHPLRRVFIVFVASSKMRVTAADARTPIILVCVAEHRSNDSERRLQCGHSPLLEGLGARESPRCVKHDLRFWVPRIAGPSTAFRRWGVVSPSATHAPRRQASGALPGSGGGRRGTHDHAQRPDLRGSRSSFGRTKMSRPGKRIG